MIIYLFDYFHEVSKMYDVIIIGSGPAGLTASIYTGRARLKTLLAAGVEWGGQLMLTTEVENFPGFVEGIQGPDLIDRMRKQAERYGVEIVFENANAVDFSSRPFKITVGNNVYKGMAVIIATGASPRWLGLESEERLRGRGVSICATCDAPFFRDKKVVVVGGGDTAVDEALTLTKFAREVKVVHRRDKLRATKILQERVFKNKKIEFIWNSTIQEILGKDQVKGVRLNNTDSGEETELACDGVFVAIGYKPNTEIFRGQIELDERGYIIAEEETKTNIEGVFVAGDVQDDRYRQAVTSAGAGCKAALDVERYLEKII
jgi:thioredoxin reductase (NADPH)